MDLRSCLWWVISTILGEVRILIHFEKRHCLGSTVLRVERAGWEPAPVHYFSMLFFIGGLMYWLLQVLAPWFHHRMDCCLEWGAKSILYSWSCFIFAGDLLQQQEKYVKQKKLIAFWQFLWTPRKACKAGKDDCFLAVCVNTTKHCSLLQRVGSGYQKPRWVKNEIKWKARKMRSKHC